MYYEPTVVNNVETLANVPYILVNGADSYRENGTEQSPGTKIFCMCGHLNKPGNYELPLGSTFRELIYDHAGGVPGDKAVKAILPSGASGPVVPGTDEVLDTPLTYEAMEEIGTVLGSASVIVMDEDTDMVWATLKMARFFHHESCGKCAPCREGTYWVDKAMTRLVKGEASMEDIDLLANVAGNIQGVTLCALGDFAANPVLSTIQHFRGEYEAYVSGKAPAKSASAAD